ncbi:MAG: FHA domain-containing protein [Burkholderiaceae bacterium]|nr:FHA domain-containing protein [Burkholderiaceae bacterium]
MHVANRPLPGLATIGPRTEAPQAAAGHDLEVVLEPLSRPELGEIRVGDSVFAVGRNEQPFASYDPEILVMLSRRHARIFCEGGAVYLADLESRNGTTLNRAAVQNKPMRLADGDEIGFGGVLSYRVRITSHVSTVLRAAGPTLTLTPAAGGNDPIVIARFPFLVSKNDPNFARHRAGIGKQFDFLSRRHAHIFLKGGQPHIEDLASTNGTFLDGERLQEHAVPLHDGMLLAFGGEQFVYRVGLQKASAPDAGATRTIAPAAGDAAAAALASEAAAGSDAPAAAGAAPQVNAGKTTFVAAPDSFLDIFCAETEMPPQPEAAGAAPVAEAAVAEPQPAKKKKRERGRAASMAAEFMSVLAGGDSGRVRGVAWKVAAMIAAIVVVALGLSWWVQSERELKRLIERGEFAQAAARADEALQADPNSVELKALATEASLKAVLPKWLARVAARDFAGASAAAAELAAFGKRTPELLPLAGELEWLGSLEQLLASRGADAPIRIYADEDAIAAVIERWNRDTRDHQRSLARIASYVPEFNTPYAEALTRLRKLQSDATVYLTAIDRIKSTISAEVARDRAEDLQPVLKEAAERYPDLGGLDQVRKDLDRYIEIRREARSRQPGRLLALLSKERIGTPPFRESLQALRAAGQLPSAEVVHRYDATTRLWRDGRTAEALAGLQALQTGPWAQAAAAELQRKQALLALHAALQQSRGTPTHADALIALREALDADEDVFFARASAADVEQQKALVLARAQGLINRAQSLWQEYRAQGGIDAALRIETSVTARFRNQARLLSEARQTAQRGEQVRALAGATATATASAIGDEIQAEARAQRSALLDLRNVLDAQLVKEKLSLLGERAE